MGGNVNDFVAQQAVLAAEAEMGIGRFGFGGAAGSSAGMGMLATIVDGESESEEGPARAAAGVDGTDEVDKYLKLGSEHATTPGIRIPGRESAADAGGYLYPFEGGAGVHGPGLTSNNATRGGYGHISTLPFHPSSLPTHGFYGFPPGQMHHTWGSSSGGVLHAGRQGHGLTFRSAFGLGSGTSADPSLPLTPSQSLTPSHSITPSQSVSLTPAQSLTPSQSSQSLSLSTSQAQSPHSNTHPQHPLTPPHVLGPPNPFQFPRRVRKTSFDHTVSREGIGMGVGMGVGRHQVNGRPSWVGTPSTLVSCEAFCLFVRSSALRIFWGHGIPSCARVPLFVEVFFSLLL